MPIQDPQVTVQRRIDETRRYGMTGLDLHGLKAESLPESVGELTNLTELYLYDNHFTRLPESLGRLESLTELYAEGNQLVELPQSLGRLSKLRVLNLARNHLTHLPDALGQLGQLSQLDLRENKLVELPFAIGQLGALTELSLQNNHLTALPSSLGQLRTLIRLDLSNNRLTRLPDSLGHLTNLTELDLDENQLVELPGSLVRLVNLAQLFLHDNEKLNFPADILGPSRRSGWPYARRTNPARILAYIARTRQGSRPLNEAKVILLGRGEVGKTSLVNRLVHDTFNPSEPITHGIKITRWPFRLGPDDITLRVWDFGGQDILRATHQFFLTERALYLVVLDGRQGQEDTEAEFWLQLVQSFGGDSPVLVVLNKVGQQSFDVNQSGLVAKYPNIKRFLKTDCCDRTGIEALRQTMAEELDRMPSLRASFPAAWFAIKDRLLQMSENYLTFERYGEICCELQETDADAQEQLSVYLHILGIFLNYRDDPRLNDKHILNPDWVTGGIYALLTSPKLKSQGGILHPADLASILDPKVYPRPMHRFLLDLMRKFDVCFALPDDSGRYLVPELLGKQEPDVARFVPEECLNFEYRYLVLPEGLLPRFIARTHLHSLDRPRWRTGVVLGFDGCEALVVANPTSRRVRICVNGPPKRGLVLLTLIRSELDGIHREFRTNPPEVWIPLPGFPETAVPYRDLLIREEKGRQSIEVVIGDGIHEFEVSRLLEGVDLPGPRSRPDESRVRIFVSYSHLDETHKATLGGHLLPLVQEGRIHWWDDRHLRPGDDWAGDIDRNLDAAEIVLLLVSNHFLASRYCREVETPAALAGRGVVVPIILDDADTSGQPFMSRLVLPTDNRPILLAKHWPDANDGWRAVVAALREVVRRQD